MNQKFKQKIIEAGVDSLTEFGYNDVTIENIMTDGVYKVFFEKMLKDNIGGGFDEEINSILDDMEVW